MRGFESLVLVLCAAAFAVGCKGNKCDLDDPDCGEEEVCLPDPENEDKGVCTPNCDPLDPEECGSGVCNAVDGGGYGCFDPLVMTGTVFDAETEAAIEDAAVMAADETGAVVTTVVFTAADGSYSLTVPALRDPYGEPVQGTFTLRSSAADYQPYPAGIRPAIPIDATTATWDDVAEQWVLSTAATSVALIALPEDEQGRAAISGTVTSDLPGGTLVVVECADPPCPFGYAGLEGSWVVHNVPDGSYDVQGYRVGVQLTAAPVTVSGASLTGIELAPDERALGSVGGSLNIVDAPGGSRTSVVLIPTSTFQQITETFVRGEVGPGLRAPQPPLQPDVSGAYTITGVPDGTYKVLAAFENDGLIRDPDPGISGTQIVEVEIPAGGGGRDVTIPTNFKVTAALAVESPGATLPEEVDPEAGVDLVFASDSSTPTYAVAVYDAFGDEVWSTEVADTPGSGPITVEYGGPLDAGMTYQFRAISLSNAAEPRSTTEDLLGVFYVP